MSTNNKQQKVEMHLRYETIAKVDKLREKIDLPSKADTIRMAVDIADIVVDAIKKGKKVVLYVEGNTVHEQITIDLGAKK